MAKTKRDLLKRRLAQAHNHLDRAIEDLLQLRAVFAEQHPEHAQALETMARIIYDGQLFIETFAEATWGTKPEDWLAWRNPGTAPQEPDDESEGSDRPTKITPARDDPGQGVDAPDS